MDRRPTDPPAEPHRPQELFDWFFRDRRSGRIVVAQFPNLALGLWLGTIVLRQFVEAGTTARDILDWAGWLALGWWSVDELLRGLNPWRRLLGLAGCAVVVVGIATRIGP